MGRNTAESTHAEKYQIILRSGFNDWLESSSVQVWIRAAGKEARGELIWNCLLHDRANKENITGLWVVLRLSAERRFVHWPVSILDEINTSSFSGPETQEAGCWISNPHQLSLLSSSCLTATLLNQTCIACHFTVFIGIQK